ncbi:MAG TPA: hypothetical protein VGA98_05800 [Allosphingosinicella sp.]
MGTGERLALAAATLCLIGAGVPPAAPETSKVPVMLMTGLPIVWGEAGPFDPGSRPAAAYVELQRDFSFRPVDVLDEASLARGKLLFLAQPHRLGPAELADLDAWIRGGGRALILTDPILNWPSELALGDIRRPPPTGLLAPRLGHWRLALDPPAAPGEVAARWNERPLAMDSPGAFRSSNPDCIVAPEGWTALCRLGRGRVRLVADADLMRDPLWAPDGGGRRAADNPAIVGEWLDELAETPRHRPRLPEAGAGWVGGGLIALALLAAATGIGLLLRRRRGR